MSWVNKIAFFTFILIFISCRGTTSKKPPIHLLQNMDDVGRLDPQSNNYARYMIDEEPYDDLNSSGTWDINEPYEDLNENGIWDKSYEQYINDNLMSMNELVHGTVSRDIDNQSVSDKDILDYALRQSGRDENGFYISKIPSNYVIDEKLVNRGEERYNIFCSPCHGISGNGMGAVMNNDYSWNRGVRPANLLDLTDKEDICDDGYLYDVITNGKGRMGGYGHQIGLKDRWAIVSYLRVLAYASGSVPECCSDLVIIKNNLKKMKSLEAQLLSDDFECMVENHSKSVQNFYGRNNMEIIQDLIRCDAIDGEWGPGSRNKWRKWKSINK